MQPELQHARGSVMKTAMSSNTAAVTSTVRTCEAFMKRHCEGDTLGASVVLQELLKNAAVHGNRCSQTHMVGVAIEYLGERRFRIQVEDQGNGFNAAALDMSLPEDPRTITRRGYVLINSLSDRLEFSDRGNCVTAYVTLPEETSRTI